MKREKSRGGSVFFIIYVILVILTAVSGLLFVSLYFGDSGNLVSSEKYDKYYVMITDNNQSDFWQSVYQGAYEYGIQNGVYVEDLASTMTENLSKEELMRIAIASNVDGIMLNADESEELNELIEEAISKNIPVVTLFNDASSSSRISYVGVGNYNIGREYGIEALSLAADIIADDPYRTSINVVVLVNQVPTSGQMMVYSTIQEAFDADVYSSVLNLSFQQIDNSNTFSAEESIRDLFMDGDTPDIIICLSELDTECVYQAVIDYNKVGTVNVLGYYDSDTVLQGISRNIIDSTIRVDTNQMGRYCVDAILEYERAGFTSQYFAVDIAVINSSNIEEYLEGNDAQN